MWFLPTPSPIVKAIAPAHKSIDPPSSSENPFPASNCVFSTYFFLGIAIENDLELYISMVIDIFMDEENGILEFV